MSPLKEACLIAKGLKGTDLETLKMFVDLLAELDTSIAPGSMLTRAPDTGKPTMLNEAQLAARRNSLNKARAKRWPQAARVGNVPSATTAKVRSRVGRARGSDTAIARVWAAVKQSSGPLTTRELTEILGINLSVVSNAMTELHRAHPAILKRVRVKQVTDENGNILSRGGWQYTYHGKPRTTTDEEKGDDE